MLPGCPERDPSPTLPGRHRTWKYTSLELFTRKEKQNPSGARRQILALIIELEKTTRDLFRRECDSHITDCG